MYQMWLKILELPYIVSLPLYFLVLAVIETFRKKKHMFNKSNLYKLFFITVFIDLVASLLIQLVYFLNKDLGETIIHTPYASSTSITVVLEIMLVCGILLFIINKKVIFYKKDLKQINTICLLLSLLIFPYFIFLPLKEVKTEALSNYTNTYIGDNSSVGGIIDLLDIKMNYFSLKTTEEPYILTINLKSSLTYKELEKDSSIMFNLITNVSTINYIDNSKTYTFNFIDLNSIYNNNLRGISLDTIYERYAKEVFNSDGIYMGHILNYDIFDESITCEENEELIKDDYYITCSSLDTIYLYSDSKYNIKEKLGELSIEGLLKTNLNIHKK